MFWFGGKRGGGGGTLRTDWIIIFSPATGGGPLVGDMLPLSAH